MVWIALALLALTLMGVGLNTLEQRWGMGHWRSPRGFGPSFQDWVEVTAAVPLARPGLGVPAPAADVQSAVLGATRAVLDQSDFYVFSTWVVFSVFLSFLLPLWSLSFATDALGGEREDRTLIWLLTQPLPRPLIYLAKFVALLPYALGLNLGGFALLCAAAGRPGALAFRFYWPAVLLGSLAFCALFHFMGACFRRSAVVAIVYSFFLETIVGNMPGTMKRVSISFYTRCMMFDKAQQYGVQPEKPSIYMPVDARTALWVLVSLTILLVIAGMAVFARSEYQDLT
jgi:ABC-type transport system involved in multi-copper enzyme maturation permease subunit